MKISEYKNIVNKNKEIENKAILICIRMLEIDAEILGMPIYETINIISVDIQEEHVIIEFTVTPGDSSVIYIKEVESKYLYSTKWEEKYVNIITNAQRKRALDYTNENEPVEYVGPFECPSCLGRVMLHWKDARSIHTLTYNCPFCKSVYSIDRERIL